MDIKAVSCAEFLCEGRSTAAPASPNSFEELAPTLQEFLGGATRDLGQGYVLHTMTSGQGDVALLYKGEPVGAYWGEMLSIAEGHRGKALSIPIILAAIADRPKPDSRTVSVAGKRALEAAWRVANGLIANPWP